MRLGVRCLVMVAAVAGVVGLSVPGAWAKPAHCDKQGVCTAPSKLKWSSPGSISDGVPATFVSGGRCPDVRPDGSPLQGTRAVQITVLFSTGGGVGNVGPVASDGSWTFAQTCLVGGFSDPQATVTASCLDVTNTGFVIATYGPHAIAVNA
jgi:hypothetical protein